MERFKKYAGVIRDSICWKLGTKKPFIINDEYKLELLYIDNRRGKVEIRITNIKEGTEVIKDV